MSFGQLVNALILIVFAMLFAIGISALIASR